MLPHLLGCAVTTKQWWTALMLDAVMAGLCERGKNHMMREEASESKRWSALILYKNPLQRTNRLPQGARCFQEQSALALEPIGQPFLCLLFSRLGVFYMSGLAWTVILLFVLPYMARDDKFLPTHPAID
jgi:hypothetical protein